MNLSNKDLHYALWCAEKHTGNSLYAEAMADLEEAILEIEGYERVEWTRFDLNDPRTFPPNDTMVLYNCKGEVYYGDFTDVSKSSLFEVGATFWRPLPKPPVETEDAK